MTTNVGEDRKNVPYIVVANESKHFITALGNILDWKLNTKFSYDQTIVYTISKPQAGNNSSQVGPAICIPRIRASKGQPLQSDRLPDSLHTHSYQFTWSIMRKKEEHLLRDAQNPGGSVSVLQWEYNTLSFKLKRTLCLILAMGGDWRRTGEGLSCGELHASATCLGLSRKRLPSRVTLICTD